MNLDDNSIETECILEISGIFSNGYWKIYRGFGCYYFVIYDKFSRRVFGGHQSLCDASRCAYEQIERR